MPKETLTNVKFTVKRGKILCIEQHIKIFSIQQHCIWDATDEKPSSPNKPIKLMALLTGVNDVKHVSCCHVCPIVRANRPLMMYIYMHMLKVSYDFVKFLFVWNPTSAIR